MNQDRARVRIAVQKSGRLTDRSMQLLNKAGLEFDWQKATLFCGCQNFPVDLMLLRDDDIPEYLFDGVCDLAIVGQNVLLEKTLSKQDGGSYQIVKHLGFGKCRLALAIRQAESETTPVQFAGKTIATSYPFLLKAFLQEQGIAAKVIEISGSVEIAPTLDIADAICDLVSTGSTLKANGLQEVQTILESQSVLVQRHMDPASEKQAIISKLLSRIDGVLAAQETKYIMMNAPVEAVAIIKTIVPGMEEPSVIPLGADNKRVAIHAVAKESIFWETMERLKAAGASSILVLPIEKIIF